jgi:hypothetical protein
MVTKFRWYKKKRKKNFIFSLTSLKQKESMSFRPVNAGKTNNYVYFVQIFRRIKSLKLPSCYRNIPKQARKLFRWYHQFSLYYFIPISGLSLGTRLNWLCSILRIHNGSDQLSINNTHGASESTTAISSYCFSRQVEASTKQLPNLIAFQTTHFNLHAW